MKIAIQKDSVIQPGGIRQSFSSRWIELASQLGIDTEVVDVYAHDSLKHIAECDGFMWRYGYDPLSLQFAKRFLPAIEHGLGIPVFPDWKTSWSFEDKVAQRYLLDAANIASPETWVFWRKSDALAFAEGASYPFVLKLTAGIRSGNVILIKNRHEAITWVNKLFDRGVHSLSTATISLPSLAALGKQQAKNILRRRSTPPKQHHGYFYAQEFLPHNDFDTRVTVIGRRAFAFRRFNRENDFRASGSGKIDWNPAKIDLPTVQLAFHTAQTLGTQSVAVDGMRRGDERLVGEVSYTYAAWAIEACPGHWELQGTASNGEMRWKEGALKAEDAIFEDFLARFRLV